MFYDLEDIVDLTGVVVKPRTLAERSSIQASAGLPFVVALSEQILFLCFYSSLGTYFPHAVTAPGEGLSIWHFTIKLFRFRCSKTDHFSNKRQNGHYWIATTRRPLRTVVFHLFGNSTHTGSMNWETFCHFPSNWKKWNL